MKKKNYNLPTETYVCEPYHSKLFVSFKIIANFCFNNLGKSQPSMMVDGKFTYDKIFENVVIIV